MKVTFVTNGSLTKFAKDGLSDSDIKEAVLFANNGLGLVTYKRELDGSEGKLEEMARLSKDLRCLIVSGCDTNTFGNYHHSVAVADNGKLLGISDCLYESFDSQFKSGVGLNCFKTTVGRVGIIVGDDLYNPRLFDVLSTNGAEVVICVVTDVNDYSMITVVRSNAICYGFSVVLCGVGFSCVSNNLGEITFCSRKSITEFNVPTVATYKSYEVKRRIAIK